jgi:hypothetical protein
MATATTPPNASTAPGYDQFVDSRIAKTRTAVKSADVATGVVALIAWALVVLLVAAVADHWIVAGGLDRWERYALWGIGLAGAGLHVATRLGPNLWRSVNPLYAARELERETPELKNSLLNLLQLRGATDSPAIKQALERQAAERLARAGDAPIDHTPLVRAAKLLLALVALVGVYVVASPKDFFASAGRVLAPWSQIAAPSRVRITAVEPGAVTLAQGARLNVTAMVSGLDADELVELVYTSDDRQAVGRRVPMTASRGGVQFSGSLPAGSGAASALGLQGSLTYRIEAGDAHTSYYQVEVLTAPTIAPVTVRYEYPPYTGYKTREVEGVGDLRAIEGTRVLLSVEANLPIESAQIDIGADGRPDVRMTAEGKKATGTFVLRHDGDGATSTSNYVLRFTSTDGQANNDPPQYQIEVLRDLPPEAAIREPEAESIDVALNQRVRVAIEARDPDYALKRVRLVGEAAGKQVLEQDLLRGDGKGGFKAETEIVPQAIGLRPGDVLDYWVEATDNRTPQPNVSVSERRQLRVMAPGDGQQGDRRDGEQQNGEGGDPRQDQQGDPNGEGDNGEQQQDDGAGQPNQGQPNQDQPGEPQQPGESGESGQQGGQGKSQANEDENQQGENGQPPPGGMTGPGNEGGVNSENEAGDGKEGSSSSKPNDGENSPAGGSQAGETNQGQRNDQPQPGGNQSGQNGGDQSSAGKPSPNNQQQGKQPGEQPQGGEPNAGEQSGGEQSDGEGAGENPVARDGSDDGSAFDKMLDWMKQQQGDKPSGKPSPSNQKNQDGGENGEASQDTEQAQDAQQNGGEESQDEGQSQEGQGRGDESQQGQSKKQQDQSKEQQGQSSDQQGQSGDESDASASEDEGGASESDEKQDVAGESNGRQGERGKEGQGGADGKQQPRNQPGGQQPERNEKGPGAGEQDRSGQQSQSKSSESGGDTPPGESSKRDAGPREGTDGAGQSQAADRGAGQSADKGAGDTSGREGGEQASDKPTGGESGDDRGAGSKSRESESGEGIKSGEGDQGDAGDKQSGAQEEGGKQQGGQSGKSSEGSEGPQGREGESGQQQGDDSQPNGDAQQNSDQQNSLDDQRGKGARDSRSPVGDGGGPMELADRGATSDAAGEGAESGGDAANLDYAREQTELVLQRLDDQLRKKEVDRKLLDKLGWTEEDLQDFVNRWQSRQQKAVQRGAEGEAELDRALRSLGLNKKGPTAKSNVTDDSFRDLRENARAKTPPRMREQVESYLRSINAADDAPTSNE